jgi:AraC-like DNA-binding protein
MYYQKGLLHPDRVMAVHDLVYIDAGEWEIMEDGRFFVLKPGDVIILFAGNHHGGRKKCLPDTRTTFIHFFPLPGDRYSTGRPPVPADGQVAIATSSVAAGHFRIKTLLSNIIHAHWSDSPKDKQLGGVVLNELLIELAHAGEPVGRVGDYPIQYVVQFLERNPHTFLSLDEMSSRFKVSCRTLTAAFRRRTGKSIHQFQLEYKVRMASDVLSRSPRMSVKETAHLFGFYDEYHFSKVFKKITGKNPSEIRSR